MTMPNKKQIVEKATEMWRQDRIRANDPSFDINPEIEELREGGYLSSAQSELMRDSASHEVSEWKGYIQQIENVENFGKISETIPFNVKEAMDNGFFVCGTSQSGKTNLAKHLVKKLMDHGINVIVLDTSQAWLHDSPINQVTEITPLRTCYSWNGSEILDISKLSSRERVTFVNQFCNALYRKHVHGFRESEFIIFEDSQAYLPNGSLRLSVRKTPIYDGALDIVTMGANYNLRFGLITQFPALVDKSPVKITMQRYFGLTWEKNDIGYIQFFIGKEWAQQLKTLLKGEFIYQYRGDVEKIKTTKFLVEKTESQTQKWFNMTVEVRA